MPINVIAPFTIPIPDNQQMADSARKFEVAFTDEIKTLAGLIETYNNAERREDQIKALSILKRSFSIMQHRFPNDLKQYYNLIYHEQVVKPLFNNIKQEEIALGLLVPSNIQTLSEFVANLPQEQLDGLMTLLLEPGFTQEKLQNASFLQDNSSREDFRRILTRYEIDFLGGHNSKNFKCKDMLTGDVSVMKLENRMNMPKEAVDVLREEALSNVFTPEWHEREGICHVENNQILSRSLLFTGYYPKGDLRNDAKNQPSDDAKRGSAIDKYIQMSRILNEIQKEGYCFPDMKNGNWLIDEFGQLRIADTKSFLHARAEDVEITDFFGDTSTETRLTLNRTDSKNNFYSLPRSQHMSPPELESLTFDSPNSIDIDHMHAYMLGKNLGSPGIPVVCSYLNHANCSYPLKSRDIL